MSATPAGWYPDPGTPGQQRYWDGAAWTDHTAPLAPQAPAPPPAAAQPAYSPPPAYIQQPGQVPYQAAPYQQAPPAIFGGHTLAGWGARFGAALLDGLIVAAVSLVFLGIGFALGEDAAPFVWIAGYLLVVALYAPILMARGGDANGQTWGKQAVNVRVVREDGRPVDFGFALLREFAVKTLLFGVVGGFFFSIPTLLNYLWPLWDDGNQALHDKIVSSRVVKS